jgi:hypothetical protein
MKNLVTGILVVSIAVVAGCNPFLDRVKETGSKARVSTAVVTLTAA